MNNPKTEPTDNTKKDPMSGSQVSTYDRRPGILSQNLCEQAGTPDEFKDNLSKSEASS
jgi:hypothetical protein